MSPIDSRARLPAILGNEAAGVVVEVGGSVRDFKAGDRIAYVLRAGGAYCDERIIPADQAVKLPKFVSDEAAASAMLKGMTVEYLFHRTYPLKKGQTILFHGAAGGVGLIACQWAKRLGCKVIGTVGSLEKAKLAKKFGCDHTILYREENIAERVMEITKGRGVPVVYDSVGKDTFEASLNSLALRGMLVSFGQSSGFIPPVDTKVFAAKALFFTRPSLFHYTSTREELLLSAKRLFDVIRKKAVKVEPHQKYSLRDVADAHRDLEARKLTGSTILLP